MKQLVHLLEKIRVRKTKQEYYHLGFHAKLHGAEMPPLELGLSEEEESAFDPKTDKILEDRAQQILKEAQWLKTFR